MKPTIEYADFEKLDLRVGKILDAQAPVWTNKLIQFRVDFGTEIGERTILSGIQKYYEPSSFVGKNFPFIINLAERKMGEGVSQGMMVMADSDEKPTVFELPGEIAAGMVIR